jgi:prepilin-type N-terminal cleavage/methylation domain-containing protein
MTHRAFTLIETLVVVTLTSLIMGVLGSLLVYFYRTNAYVFQQAAATAEARRGVSDAMRAVREASYGTDGSDPIQTAATSTLAFWADIDNDDELETIQYTLANGTLTRTRTPTGGQPSVTLSSSVVNSTTTPLFRYFNAAGTELTQPVDESAVASITMALMIELDTNRGPAPFTLSGKATLRNTRP